VPVAFDIPDENKFYRELTIVREFSEFTRFQTL